jgi:hypothetical protein
MGKADVLDAGHQLAAARGLLNFHLHLAGIGPPLLPGQPHSFQGPHAAFVAGAASFDACADPDFFLGELLIKQVVLLLLSGEEFLLAFEKGVVVTRPIKQLPAVNFQDPRRQLAEKHAIVGDE